jgi:hypothetical protein
MFKDLYSLSFLACLFPEEKKSQALFTRLLRLTARHCFIMGMTICSVGPMMMIHDIDIDHD